MRSGHDNRNKRSRAPEYALAQLGENQDALFQAIREASHGKRLRSACYEALGMGRDPKLFHMLGYAHNGAHCSGILNLAT